MALLLLESPFVDVFVRQANVSNGRLFYFCIGSRTAVGSSALELPSPPCFSNLAPILRSIAYKPRFVNIFAGQSNFGKSDSFHSRNSAFTVGGTSLSTWASKVSAGTFATRTAVTCWRSEIPASRAACFWEILTAPSLFSLGRPRPSNCFNNSPQRRIARACMRSLADA